MLVTVIMSTTQYRLHKCDTIYTWHAASKLGLIVNDSVALHNMAHKDDFPDAHTGKYCYKHCRYKHNDYIATVVVGQRNRGSSRDSDFFNSPLEEILCNNWL
jgi:hypothetical protein